jgi:hypothetical protein
MMSGLEQSYELGLRHWVSVTSIKQWQRRCKVGLSVEKKEHYTVQIVVPEGAYTGADELIEDLTSLVEGNSEIEIVSVEQSQEGA